jgi:hypothetical protein
VSNEQLPVISIDQADTVELIELLEFVEAWLADASPVVNADYRPFVDNAYPLTALRTDLLTWAARLALAPGESR